MEEKEKLKDMSERGWRIGFIGEEVGQLFPEVVHFDPEDPRYVDGMDYSKMAPILLQAIKELASEVEELKMEGSK
jgi:hypothetical protein